MPAVSCLPQISISLAPPPSPSKEPSSLFEISTPTDLDEDYAPRAKHLTPPPSTLRFGRPLSPLSPLGGPRPSNGLERSTFEALLRSSRDRNTVSVGKKTLDLRKEIALKAHKNKQVERRALFLSKVLAPPSPTATSTPKTPPESPAIFHYTLPSPGLVSPLALFESLHEESPTSATPSTCKPWVEQVDFRLVDGKVLPRKPVTAGLYRSSALPSLDQISARLTCMRAPAQSAAPRLPAFLAQPRQQQPAAERPRLPAAVGRLKMPVRAPKAMRPEPLNLLPPKSPLSPLWPKLQVTTLVVSRSSNVSPTELTETNVLALDSRERRSKNMLSTLKRRVVHSVNGSTGYDDDDDRRSRRRSAPADLGPNHPRLGFEHPVLALPGGF